jgi:hypothetical protein
MADDSLTPVPGNSANGGYQNSLNWKWILLLVAYGLLLIGTGYIAFFQPQYNPAAAIDEVISAQIADENTREMTIEALKEEGLAFKARQELAVQSFNIVLGAVLGFLSATATQFIIKREPE